MSRDPSTAAIPPIHASHRSTYPWTTARLLAGPDRLRAHGLGDGQLGVGDRARGVYFVLRRLLHALAPSDRSDLEREAELLVLRHQLKVLSRSVRRPAFRTRDRMLLAAASRILPRHRWRAFVVTPRTLLRWHRELVRR